MRIDNGGDQFKANGKEKKGYSLLDAAKRFRISAIPAASRRLALDCDPGCAVHGGGEGRAVAVLPIGRRSHHSRC